MTQPDQQALAFRDWFCGTYQPRATLTWDARGFWVGHPDAETARDGWLASRTAALAEARRACLNLYDSGTSPYDPPTAGMAEKAIAALEAGK